MDIQYGVTQRCKAKAKSKDSSKSAADRFDIVDTGRYYGPLPLHDEDEELNPDFLVLDSDPNKASRLAKIREMKEAMSLAEKPDASNKTAANSIEIPTPKKKGRPPKSQNKQTNKIVETSSTESESGSDPTYFLRPRKTK